MDVLTPACSGLHLSGVPEQTSELGVGSLPAHGACHGYRKHPTLCWVQQTQHHAGGESQMESSCTTSRYIYLLRSRIWSRSRPDAAQWSGWWIQQGWVRTSGRVLPCSNDSVKSKIHWGDTLDRPPVHHKDTKRLTLMPVDSLETSVIVTCMIMICGRKMGCSKKTHTWPETTWL